MGEQERTRAKQLSKFVHQESIFFCISLDTTNPVTAYCQFVAKCGDFIVPQVSLSFVCSPPCVIGVRGPAAPVTPSDTDPPVALFIPQRSNANEWRWYTRALTIAVKAK
jgi:hypothetical protein